jgi:hypothetical protein
MEIQELDQICQAKNLEWLLRKDYEKGYFLHVYEVGKYSKSQFLGYGKDMNVLVQYAIHSVDGE